MTNSFSPGDDVPTPAVWAVIECPQGQGVRTRLGPNGQAVPVRTLPPGIFYPYGYGFIEGTRVADGEELDAFVLGAPAPAGTRVEVVPIGALAFRDRRGDDPKVIAVPVGQDAEDPLAAVAQRIGRFLREYKPQTEPRTVGKLLSVADTVAILRAAQTAFAAEVR